MSKSSSTKFFGAAGVYNNFNSTAFAQQLTDTLGGNTPTGQAQVSNTNVVDVAAEQAGQQIDALAQATKAGLSQQINTVASAAGSSATKPAPTIVTTATLTATTTATPPKAGDTPAASASTTTATTDTGAATSTTSTGSTTGTATTAAAATQADTQAAADSGKVDVPGSDDDLLATPKPALVVPTVVVPAVVAAPVSTGYSAGTWVLIIIGALFAVALISLVGYMLYTKKSAGEAFEAFKANLSSVFGKAPTNTTVVTTVK